MPFTRPHFDLILEPSLNPTSCSQGSKFPAIQKKQLHAYVGNPFGYAKTNEMK